jgi:hypothetical protein
MNEVSMAVLSLSMAVSTAEKADVSTRVELDCGLHALYVLMHLEDQALTLADLLDRLPPRSARGYSMAELRDTAGRLGLPLDGIQLGESRAPLPRPAIVFMTNAQNGHFVVLRPVGTTGTMVQVIDPPRVPRIVDYADLVKSKSWTGRALVRAEGWLNPRSAAAAALAASAALTALLAVRGWRGIRPARARPSAIPPAR